jgi:uncharacterized integral membrane protein (TIGR00697 family)
VEAVAHTSKASRLYLLLGAFFVTNALLAEFIGIKVFSLERTLGREPVGWRLFADAELSFNLTAGVLLWPVVFVMTDVVNEYFGMRGVRRLSFLAAGLIVYAFAAVFGAMRLAPAEFWVVRETASGPLDMELAFETIFGQGLWIVAGSLTAFLIGQLVDVATFHALKLRTGERWIWLRATGSTVVSQFVDSFVVLLIAFWIGARWDLSLVLSIAVMNYVYKFVMAVLLTPVIYLAHGIIERWLGPELAGELRRRAAA